MFEKWGCKKTFEFVVFKLLDWRGREKELEEHANPFALFVLAHLQSLATRGDEKKRAQWKLRIALNIIGRGLSRADLRQWLRLLDWLLDLPTEPDRRVWAEIYKSMEEKKMPFVDHFQKRELEASRGGEQRGEIKGLLKGIESILRVKFGAEGLALLPRVQQLTDPERLDRFRQSAEVATSVEELGKLLD
jgi:hypothetical protein